MAKRDYALGEALAQVNERTMPEPFRAARAQTPVTADQVKQYGRDVLAPKKGRDRAYSMFARKNTAKTGPAAERAGHKFRTFVKRGKDGEIYKYHEYRINGKRQVVRAGKASPS